MATLTFSSLASRSSAAQQCVKQDSWAKTVAMTATHTRTQLTCATIHSAVLTTVSPDSERSGVVEPLCLPTSSQRQCSPVWHLYHHIP